MKTSDFDFQVPSELIAHEPTLRRDHSRLMVLDRARRTIAHKHFYDLVDYLNAGDLLVLNDTKVIPANLIGKKEDGGAKVEVLLTRPKTEDRRPKTWECLVKPGKRLKVGSRVLFGEEVLGTVLEKTETGEQIIEFTGDLDGFMRNQGQIPLPPYIKPPKVESRKLNIERRYQTVYAKKEGASASPTAGLHFTPELLKGFRDKGVGISHITLHTGLATFKPVYAENVEDHKMYSEYYEMLGETIKAVRKAKRVIAVGTTSVRTLEACASEITTKAQRHEGHKGETDLFIYPGYKFKVVDAMITNFHWPRTTLIMLVSAFAGKDFIMKAYQEAIKEKYRFFSFGDAMLIL
ncbi:MAG: tRNA preQ1(34) S-adenosylmethionine ribosyltransferase-isomerase QueA [Candidatus Margulisbacteria bacterium]|nr:tRNA preQ1(34) S-adenosylmethionine ribosyltransferase-isomerase QueA [Candidatus Margulisiibacteriota bacterium]